MKDSCTPLVIATDDLAFTLECPYGWVVQEVSWEADSTPEDELWIVLIQSKLWNQSIMANPAEDKVCIRCIADDVTTSLLEKAGLYRSVRSLHSDNFKGCQDWREDKFFQIFSLQICGPSPSVEKNPIKYDSGALICGLEFYQTQNDPKNISCLDSERTSNLFKYYAHMICPSSSKVSAVVKGHKLLEVDDFITMVQIVCIHCQEEKDTFSICYNFGPEYYVDDDPFVIESNQFCG